MGITEIIIIAFMVSLLGISIYFNFVFPKKLEKANSKNTGKKKTA